MWLYESVPFALQVIVIVFSTVFVGMPRKYFLAVTSPVALLPLLVAVASVIFQEESEIVYVMLEFVQVAELPV